MAEKTRPKAGPVVESEANRWQSAGATVVAQGEAIRAHLRGVSPARLGQLIRRVQLALECVRDVVRGDYRAIPWATIGALAAALSYFLAPFDVVPDFIPFVGFVDDAVVIGLVFLAARRDLTRYCLARGRNPADYFD